jgi:hypothetical protein
LREKVDRPEAEPDEGCSEERVVDKVLTARRFSLPRSVQHPSSDLPFDKLRVGHLPPQGGKGVRPSWLRLPRSVPERRQRDPDWRAKMAEVIEAAKR